MMDSPLFNRARSKLERRNALKNVDYEASGSFPYFVPQSPVHGDRCIGFSIRIREELSNKTSYTSIEGVSVINLSPPPSLAPKVRVDDGASSWDLVMAFAPEEEEVDDKASTNLRHHSVSDSSFDEEEEKEQADDGGAKENEKETELEGTKLSIFYGSNEGESSSSTTEDSVNYVSPEVRLNDADHLEQFMRPLTSKEQKQASMGQNR